MRARRPFSRDLLLSGFIMLSLSVILPWWASYATLAQHTNSPLTVLPSETAGPILSENRDGISVTPAPQQWLSTAVPLAATSLLIFLVLLRRWRQTHLAERAYLQQLIQVPDANNSQPDHPVAEAIVNLHHDYTQQLDVLKQQLQLAQQQSFQDSLTLLGNRFAFRRDLELMLNNDNQLASATLMIVRASNLQDINVQQGFQAGDQYLQDIVKIVRKAIQSEISALGYRISGTDIAVLINGQCEPLAQRLGNAIQQELHHYQHIHALSCAAYIGFTQVLSGQKAEQVLTRADLALAQAQGGEPNSWHMLLKQDEAESMGESQWRQRLQNMLDNDQILLQVQPAKIYKGDILGYNEIFARFPNASGGTYPASTVFAMLQRLNMSMLFEQKIIEMILHKIKASPLTNQRWAINLTPASLQQNSFLIWLERVLMQDRTVTSKLVFELEEQLLQYQVEAGKRLLDVIRRCGARYAVSHFGHGFGSFRLLKEIKPDYVKLDGQLVRLLSQDATTVQFVRMIVDLAQRLGCHVIAEGVETVDQQLLLESMYIDGIQGYLIAKPSDFAQFKALHS